VSLLSRRFPYGHPGQSRSVRDLGLVFALPPVVQPRAGSGYLRGVSAAWLARVSVLYGLYHFASVSLCDRYPWVDRARADRLASTGAKRKGKRMTRSGTRRRKASDEDPGIKRTVICAVVQILARVLSAAVDYWISGGGHH
jgi:hypothetical protein